MPAEKLATDARGTYRRDLGWEEAEVGTFRQHRFYLGKDEGEAARRADLLEQVWAAAERLWESWKERHGRPGSRPARPLWDEATLAVAMAVARGEQEAEVNVPAWLRDYLATARRGPSAIRLPQKSRAASPREADGVIRSYIVDLRRHVPSVRVRLADPGPEERARERLRQEGVALLEGGRRLLELAGERAMTPPEVALHAELNLALGGGLVALVFADDGIRVWRQEGVPTTVAWAVVAESLAGRVGSDGTYGRGNAGLGSRQPVQRPDQTSAATRPTSE